MVIYIYGLKVKGQRNIQQTNTNQKKEYSAVIFV